MANDYGIKVVGAGKDITSTDPRDLIMSSQYSMLKFHSDNSGTITLDTGESEDYVEFTHNLGYVPAFISYYQDYDGKIHNINTTGASGVGASIWAYSWADTTKVRCGIVWYPEVGWARYPIWPQTFAYYDTFSDYGDSNGFVLTGNRFGGNRAGCFRIPSLYVAKNETIVEATFKYTMTDRSIPADDTDIMLRILGIDEDDTADFNGSNPMTRAVTSAYTDYATNIKVNSECNFDVKTIVQEITTRSNWASGNALGLRIQHNGSDADIWGNEAYNSENSFLTITAGDDSYPFVFRTIIFKDKIST